MSRLKNIVNLLLILILTFSCSKSKPDINESVINEYFEKAEKSTNSYQSRCDYNTKALIILKNKKNDSLNRIDIFRVATNFYHISKWRELKAVSEFILSRSAEAKDSIHLAHAYKFLGYYYMYSSNNEKAYYCFLKAKKLYEKKQQLKSLSLSYYNIAEVQFYGCDYVGAEYTCFKALKYAKIYNNFEDQYRAMLFIGIISSNLGNYSKAIEYTKKALEISNKTKNNQYFIEFCFNNIGFNYFKSGNIGKSIQFYFKGLKKLKNYRNNPELYTTLLDCNTPYFLDQLV